MEAEVIKLRLTEAGIALAGKRLLIAVSGGADSMALAHLFLSQAETLSIAHIAIAHINHGLRGSDSDIDAQFVASFAQSYNCPYYQETIEGATYSGPSLENWCREKRYRFFEKCCNTHKIDYCLTAHTLNDLGESFIMRISRGVGYDGLESIHMLRDNRYLRPLLHVTREEIEWYVKSHTIAYREDASNSDERFARNAIRHSVLPEILHTDPLFLQRVLSITDHARTLRPSISNLAEATFGQSLTRISPQFALLDTANIKSALCETESKDLFFTFCNALWKRLGLTQLSSQLFDTLYNTLLTQGRNVHPLKMYLKKGWHLTINSHSVAISQGTLNAPFSVDCSYNNTHQLSLYGLEYTFQFTHRTLPVDFTPHANFFDRVYFDANKLPKECLIRNKSSKDVFSPLGNCSKTRKLTKFLSDKKVPKELHNTIPLLANTNEIIWVIGYQISENYKIDETTHTIIEMSVTCKTTI